MTIYATKGLIRMLDDAFNATNAVGAGAAVENKADPISGADTPAPRPSSAIPHTTLALIDYVRGNDMMADKALTADVSDICTRCYGAGGYDSDDFWPTAPAWLVCTGCGGEGVKP